MKVQSRGSVKMGSLLSSDGFSQDGLAFSKPESRLRGQSNPKRAEGE